LSSSTDSSAIEWGSKELGRPLDLVERLIGLFKQLGVRHLVVLVHLVLRSSPSYPAMSVAPEST
jgi:hypothetical protein